MCDKLLRALGPTGRTRGAANARSKIIIMHNLLLFGEHKMQGAILIPESIRGYAKSVYYSENWKSSE